MAIDKHKQTDCVDIIANGYQWICPTCDMLNCIDVYPKTGIVTCQDDNCGEQFPADLPEHCIG